MVFKHGKNTFQAATQNTIKTFLDVEVNGFNINLEVAKNLTFQSQSVFKKEPQKDRQH